MDQHTPNHLHLPLPSTLTHITDIYQTFYIKACTQMVFTQSSHHNKPSKIKTYICVCDVNIKKNKNIN